MKRYLSYLLLVLTTSNLQASENEISPPETGVSGVYEVMIGVDDAAPMIDFLGHFGFKVVKQGEMSAAKAKALYKVDSNLKSYRLQNHNIDSHGMIRLLEWQNPLGDGVGYAQPETVGQRMLVMRTKDIFRIHDVFSDARESGEKWFATEPVYDDLYAMTGGKLNVINRRIGVREMAAYGELLNIVFFQRYGYTIPGYGTINKNTPLQTSEVTHNDFIIPGSTKADMHSQTDYYRDVLGFKPEGPVVLDGDWQQGPKKVFNMADGASHWYRGFVSPNNISGKLKFFVNPDQRPDRSVQQKPGYLGITLHSVYSPTPQIIYQLAKEKGIESSSSVVNEFGEKSFVLHGPDGSSWQVIEKPKRLNPPKQKLEFVKTGQ